jgi:LacI family transcriptional regulator
VCATVSSGGHGIYKEANSVALRRVAIFVDMLSAYGREVLIGINRYTSAHGPWAVFGDPERIVAPISGLAHWQGDGVIAHVHQPAMQQLLVTLRQPVVNVSQYLAVSPFPTVLPDNDEVGRMGAEHLLERGFANFAFCGFAGHRYSEIRAAAFERAVRPRNATFSRFDTDPPQERPEEWDDRQAELADWIRSLPRPVGVLCCNDARARHVAQVCLDIGVRVPEEVALIGADNDELVCEMSNPPLSSIDVSAERVGFEAAALLDRLMKRQPPPDRPVLVPPTGVVTRRSSDLLAIADATVAAAVRLIRDHAHEALNVSDVADALPVSRRVLERRFRQTLGRTIGQQIALTRIDRAKQLLIHTDSPTPTVAERAGFRYVQQFNALFKKHTGQTPTQFRRAHRTG